MSKAGSASKVKINSFDDLFGASQAPAGTEQVREIPLSELHEFKGHPFKVLDDEKMQETVESIRNYGVLMPGIARPRAGGGYEIIAGHRRKHGCELAGLSTMPMFVRDYSDDEATVIMVDTNIQREDILPSEKARAYAMKYEAMKHQGKKGSPKRVDAGVHQVVVSHIEEHSRKPGEVHERIRRLMGDVPKIELFARRKAEGFDVWGNEVDSDIEFKGGNRLCS